MLIKRPHFGITPGAVIKRSSIAGRILTGILAASVVSAPFAAPSVLASEPDSYQTNPTTVVKSAEIPPAVETVAKLLLALGVGVALFSSVTGFV
jgi:hypothetical protein